LQQAGPVHAVGRVRIRSGTTAPWAAGDRPHHHGRHGWLHGGWFRTEGCGGRALRVQGHYE